MNPAPPPDPDRARSDFVLSVVNVVGLGGLGMLGIVLVALFLGLLADRFLGTRPLFTVGLLVLSAPLSIFLMLRIATKAVAKIKPYKQAQPESQGEE